MLDILTFFVFFTLACKLEISVVKTKNQHWIGFQYRTLYISYAEPADFVYQCLCIQSVILFVISDEGYYFIYLFHLVSDSGLGFWLKLDLVIFGNKGDITKKYQGLL